MHVFVYLSIILHTYIYIDTCIHTYTTIPFYILSDFVLSNLILILQNLEHVTPNNLLIWFYILKGPGEWILSA